MIRGRGLNGLALVSRDMGVFSLVICTVAEAGLTSRAVTHFGRAFAARDEISPLCLQLLFMNIINRESGANVTSCNFNEEF